MLENQIKKNQKRRLSRLFETFCDVIERLKEAQGDPFLVQAVIGNQRQDENSSEFFEVMISNNSTLKTFPEDKDL